MTQSNTCPRCLADAGNIRVEHSAKQGGVTLWSVLHCKLCAFTWRTSEPATTIDPARRPAWTQMKSVNPADYRTNTPLPQ